MHKSKGVYEYNNSGLMAIKKSNAIEPSHYTDLKISPLEYITANEGEFTWCISNVIKYVSRYKRKNGIEDLLKSHWYLTNQIELEYNKLSEKEKEKHEESMRKVRGG